MHRFKGFPRTARAVAVAVVLSMTLTACDFLDDVVDAAEELVGAGVRFDSGGNVDVAGVRVRDGGRQAERYDAKDDDGLDATDENLIAFINDRATLAGEVTGPFTDNPVAIPRFNADSDVGLSTQGREFLLAEGAEFGVTPPEVARLFDESLAYARANAVGLDAGETQEFTKQLSDEAGFGVGDAFRGLTYRGLEGAAWILRATWEGIQYLTADDIDYFPESGGVIDETEKEFSPEERAVAEVLAGEEGKKVEAQREGDERRGDALVDGVETEFKTPRPGATDSTVLNEVQASIKGRGQGRSIEIDARPSGLSEAEARTALDRIRGVARGKLDRVRIIGRDYKVTGTYP